MELTNINIIQLNQNKMAFLIEFIENQQHNIAKKLPESCLISLNRAFNGLKIGQKAG